MREILLSNHSAQMDELNGMRPALWVHLELWLVGRAGGHVSEAQHTQCLVQRNKRSLMLNIRGARLHYYLFTQVHIPMAEKVMEMNMACRE